MHSSVNRYLVCLHSLAIMNNAAMNIGVHLQVKWSENRSFVSDSFDPMDCIGQNTGVGSLSLLQGIFPTHGSNPGLPHCRQILYQLSHKESPRILEWVAYPFSRGSSWHRNQTGVSCTADGFFTNWAIRETQVITTFHQLGFSTLNLYCGNKRYKQLRRNMSVLWRKM